MTAAGVAPGNKTASGGDGKIAAIQLLRALAAGTVALAHIALVYGDKIAAGFGETPDLGRAAQGAVMLFFVISGYVMVVSSAGLYGQRSARRVFWTRRAVRILPPYWLATGLFLIVAIGLYHRPIEALDLARSLALIPYWTEAPRETLRAVPILWVGWTLFYEMLFYLLLGLMLPFGRIAALVACAGALAALVLAGLLVDSANAVVWTATRPVLLMFLVGMALASWREAGRAMPLWSRVLAAIGGAFVGWAAPVPVEASAMGFDYLLWCAVPAGLLALAVMGGDTPLPFAKLQNAAGDISYALYLLHIPLAWAWLWLFVRSPLIKAGPWGYLVSASVIVLLVSWAFFVWIERPMTRALNQALGAQPQKSKPERS